MGIRSLTTPIPVLFTIVLLTFVTLVLHPALETLLPHPRFTFNDHGTDSTSLGSLSFHWPSSVSFDAPLPASVRFAEKYNQGEWVPRAKPITSWEEMEEVLPGAGLRRGTCRDFDGGIGDGRMFHVASQVWVGKKGGRTEWDARAMVIDLLQRRGGLFVIGGEATLFLPFFLKALELFDSTSPRLRIQNQSKLNLKFRLCSFFTDPIACLVFTSSSPWMYIHRFHHEPTL